MDDIKTVDPVAIGDIVRFVPAEEGRGLIVEVLPRKSEVVRRAAGKQRLKQAQESPNGPKRGSGTPMAASVAA